MVDLKKLQKQIFQNKEDLNLSPYILLSFLFAQNFDNTAFL